MGRIKWATLSLYSGKLILVLGASQKHSLSTAELWEKIFALMTDAVTNNHGIEETGAVALQQVNVLLEH